MYRFLQHDSIHLTRREFLKLLGSSLMGTFLLPPANWNLFNRLASLSSDDNDLPTLGRALDTTVPLYAEPSLRSQVVENLNKDDILAINWVTYGDTEPSYNRIWYQMQGGGYAHSGAIQPVKNIPNQPERNFPKTGRLASVTVPYTDSVWSYKLPQNNTAFRLYYGSNHWITASAIDDNHEVWYALTDDTISTPYYARATDLHLLTDEETSPLSPEVPASKKRVEVHIAEQIMIAYEEDIPVLITRVATGAKFGDKDLYTPKGQYYTNRKAPSRHMAHRDPTDINSYDVPGVPWVLYLTITGVAFHGTYWHNDYGKPRSHGCINLPIAIARWLYRWSLPWAPPTERLYMTAEGTTVDIL
ncbi:MAG TPA: L,D-transpeptidase [Anaerolineaceae bacterium]|nr:L,D-transpeptidase [Anaerolineaceae bacterium]